MIRRWGFDTWAVYRPDGTMWDEFVGVFGSETEASEVEREVMSRHDHRHARATCGDEMMDGLRRRERGNAQTADDLTHPIRTNRIGASPA